MIQKENRLAILLIKKVVLAGALLFGHNLASAQIAVIVNKNNAVHELSIDQLKSIFLGKTLFFENNRPIVLCEFEPDKDEFCEKTYGFSSKRMSQYWFQRIFSGSATKAPKIFKAKDNLLDYVAGNDAAIGFIKLSSIRSTENIKIVRINSLAPDESGYLLSYDQRRFINPSGWSE